MNPWLKTSIGFLILLLAQSQASLAVEEVNRFVQVAALDGVDGTVPCGADNICNAGACTQDPDCPDLPNNTPDNTAPPATTVRLTSPSPAVGISGFSGSKFTRGNPASTNTAVFAILSNERSDEPCYVAVGTENINDATMDTIPVPAIDLCGPKGPKSGTLHADFLDTNAGGSDDRVFVSGVRVCMDRGDDKVKGIHVRGKRITTSGTLVDFSPDAQDSRTNCHQDHWKSWVNCSTGQIATAVDLYFSPGNTPRSLIGIGLQCGVVTR